MQIQRLADENDYLNAQLQSQQETIENQQASIQQYQNIEDLNNKEIQHKDAQLSEQKLEFEMKLQKLHEDLNQKAHIGKEDA